MKKRFLAVFMLFAMVFVVTACGQDKGGSDDAVTVGQTWVITDDNPLDGGNAWSITSHGISEYVFMQKEDGSMESRFVDKLEAKSDTEWVITMKKDAKFADGSKVDAKALAACLNEIQEKNKLSNASAGVIKFEATGDYTLTAKTERATTDLKSILGEWTNVVYKKVGDKYVFTGPFKIKALKAQSEVTLEPNENYPDASERPATVKIKAFKDINSLKLAYESGEVDLAFGLTGEIAKELKDKKKNVIDFDAAYQYYTFLNLENDILKDPAVREAIDKGIDREAIKKTLDGGTIPTGLFAGYNSFDAKIAATYNVNEAKALLDNSGWKLEDGAKYRTKDGKELALSIKTYSSKPDLPKVSQTIASELEKLGIKVTVEVVDDISKVTKARNFDILVYAQHPSPAGSPVYFLNQFFRTGGPNNFMSYSSATTDEILDKMGSETNPENIDKLAVEAQEQILKDRPVLMTMDPKWHAAVSDKLKDYKLWNGDYYIVNSTLKVK